jgi:aerobic-type carbon monoxide dehydrogenase small subunit (CoxS/CutS family)
VTALEITLRVNDTVVRGHAEARRTLADFLREDLGLTGTHLGCEHGVCGACTVILDGRSVRSCLLLAVQADGRDVQTVEGLAGLEGKLHPLQESFAQLHGLQCGFCTPGFLIAAAELLLEQPDPDEREIREALSGNLCRCTGYVNIVKAVRATAEQMREGVES